LHLLAERKRQQINAGITTGNEGDDEWESEQRAIIEEKRNIATCYNEGELEKRLNKAFRENWLIALLARDVLQYQDIRNTLIIDGIKAAERLVKSIHK
jgi:hypothetical protein